MKSQQMKMLELRDAAKAVVEDDDVRGCRGMNIVVLTDVFERLRYTLEALDEVHEDN